MNNKLSHIAQQFQINTTIKKISPLSGGLINDTYLIHTAGNNPDYILQRKNNQIFTDIPAMMQNIYKVTTHLQQKIKQQQADPLHHTLTLIPTTQADLYHQDTDGQYWTLCYHIPNTITHHKAHTPQLAQAGGAAIGKFQAMLSDMTQPLTDTLPGFHNIDYRFQQWDHALKQNPANRVQHLTREIDWIESRRDQMLNYWSKVQTGKLPIRVTHNDTKISNILFDQNNNAQAVIDLDTVLNSTPLNDFGDAIRSYTNTGQEDDPILQNISVDMNIFRAYTQGYLSQAIHFLTEEELQSVAFSARYITFEQVLRFLLDYINGDTYYKIKYPEHNLIRTRAQYQLLQSLEHNYQAMRQIVEQTINPNKPTPKQQKKI